MYLVNGKIIFKRDVFIITDYENGIFVENIVTRNRIEYDKNLSKTDKQDND